jgi:hypothetical protein
MEENGVHHSRMRYVLATTRAVLFAGRALANALIVNPVPLTEIGALYTGELASGCEPSKV